MSTEIRNAAVKCWFEIIEESKTMETSKKIQHLLDYASDPDAQRILGNDFIKRSLQRELGDFGELSTQIVKL